MPKNLTPALSATRAAANLAEPSGELPRLLQLASIKLTARELAFAEHFAQHNNATAAYAATHPCEGWKRVSITQNGWQIANRPNVQHAVRVLLSDAAAAAVVDVQALLASDRAIVEAHERYADQVTQYIIDCCRHCHGIDHAYQWVDEVEFYTALEKADEANEARIAKKQRPLPLPSDAGGYGFSVTNDPMVSCPKCEGRGMAHAVFADTTKLTGPARAMVAGVKVTANGVELLTHDYDKAKDRLMRAAGAFGDDAASVARGAAKGAVQGVAAAQALAAKVDAMSVDDARKAYLAIANM